MTSTPNLTLPYIADAQAQKHVTHNEAIRMLDAVVHLSVMDRDLAAPPSNPSNGNRYLVAAGASGAWTGQAGRVAAYQDGAWAYHQPRTGWRCWVEDEQVLIAYDGSAWRTASGATAPSQVPLLGINTAASTTDRLAVSAPASLFTHAGTDHRLKVNKSEPSSTASVLFQSAYSGRAEIGLTGDDALRIKVSSDGTLWREALVVDAASGAVSLPASAAPSIGSLVINGDFAINQRAFAGGTLAAGAYGHDRWKAGPAGASYSVSAGGVVTLASGTLVQLVEPALFSAMPLAGRTVTVSADTPSDDLAISFAGATATLPAGSGRRSATLTVPAGATGALTFSVGRATAGSCSFARLQLDIGGLAGGWSPRLPANELNLCRRYYQRSYPLGALNGSVSTDSIVQVICASSVYTAGFSFPVRMRAAPSLTIYSRSGVLGSATNFLTGADVSLGFFGLSPGSAWYGQGGGLTVSTFYEFNYTASAEL